MLSFEQHVGEGSSNTMTVRLVAVAVFDSRTIAVMYTVL